MKIFMATGEPAGVLVEDLIEKGYTAEVVENEDIVIVHLDHKNIEELEERWGAITSSSLRGIVEKLYEGAPDDVRQDVIDTCT